MKKVELLSPAGDFDALRMAVKCGCDAVYISGKEYGARKFAKNFTLDEIEDAVRFCHLYGVKLYITVNTLIEEVDIDSFTNYVRSLHKIGVDALIMQDLGMISYVSKKFPNLEIHASTQTHNVSSSCISYMKSFGVSRVVVAREMDIDTIRDIDDDIELEVFIHGALCVSYSGQCLISSRLFGRSGNKGECAQVCRFCFDLYKGDSKVELDNEYLLSTKDLCVSSDIKKLLDLGVSSLKIEGRMKSSYYVGYVTKFYRILIDKYYNGEEVSFSDEEYNNLLVLYNREFTKGFLNFSKDVVNTKTCNHQGVILGKVLSCDKKIKVLLDTDLKQGDGVRFSNGEGMTCNYIYNDKGLLVNGAFTGDIIYLDNKVNLKEKGFIYKTVDVNLHNLIDNFSDRKVPVSFYVSAKVGKEFSVTILCDNDKITKSLGEVSPALKTSVSSDDITMKLSKLGNTPFILKDISFDIDDDIFIPLGNINALRRELVSDLISLRENKKSDFKEVAISCDYYDNDITNEISFLVRNEKQLKYLINKKVNIYVEDYSLYDKYKNFNNIFYRPSRASFNNCNVSNLLVSNNGYFFSSYDKCASDIYMNVKNSYTLNLFSKYAYKIGLSPELYNEDIYNIISSYKNRYGKGPNVEVLVYGRLELMIMKYCPVNYLTKCGNTCFSCFNNKFYLDDRRGHKFRLLGDSFHFMRVIDSLEVNKLEDISYLKSIGVTNFRIDLLDENEDDIEDILDSIY